MHLATKQMVLRVVDVVHTIPPKLTIPANVTFEATSLKDNSVPIGNATATDIQPVTITSNASKHIPTRKDYNIVDCQRCIW